MTSMGSLNPPPQVKKTLAGKIAFRTALFGVGAFVVAVGYVHFRRIADQDRRRQTVFADEIRTQWKLQKQEQTAALESGSVKFPNNRTPQA